MTKICFESIENPLKTQRYCQIDIFTESISMDELEFAIGKMDPGKAPGSDLIFGCIIQHFGSGAKNLLPQIFNLSQAADKLPKSCKTSFVILILKPNKNASGCNKYWPISLTGTLCKLMKQIIYRRLIGWLVKHSKIHFYQTAYRANHSTVDQLFICANQLQMVHNTREDSQKNSVSVLGYFSRF